MTPVQAAGLAPAQTAISGRLFVHLKELHLPTVREVYDEAARMAERERLSYEQYLLHVLERESEVRHTNRIARLLRESGLPLEKTLATFNRERLPRAQNAQLVSAIAHELIQTQEKRIRFTTSSILVQELLLAKRDLALPRYLKRMRRYDALVLDEVGYIQQSRDEMEVLFTLLADRYEQGTILLTSNLPFSKWEQVFKDPTTAAAAVDRLIHHSVIIELNLDSYRLEASRKQRNSHGMPKNSATRPENARKHN
jgi:DNA replication protein DnaC